MTRLIRSSLLLFVLLSLAGCIFASCRDSGNSKSTESESQKRGDVYLPMNFDSADLSLYIELGQYRNLTLTSKGTDNASRGSAVWNAVVESSRVIEYPEQQLMYYYSQGRARYRFYADKNNVTYEKLLEDLGITDEDIMNEAKALTKEDLVRHAILKTEGIELTEEEKDRLFGRYVDKFVTDYGYKEEYVRENLTDEIYDTMLEDKMLEALISWNTFET